MSTNPIDLREQAAAGARLLLLDLMRAAATTANERAAIDLLGATAVLDQPASWECVRSDGLTSWSGLRSVVTNGEVDLPAGERRMVLLACSLAVPYVRISLGECLAGLSDDQAGAVLAAVRHVLEGGAR